MPPSPILDYLESLRTRFEALTDGDVADYIPELAHVDPDEFGICIATHDGFVYEVGDSRQPFTIQSISKPLTYGLALEEHGEDAVLAQDRRGALRRRLQRHQPAAPDWCAAEPADQCRCNRGLRPDPRRRTVERARPHAYSTRSPATPGARSTSTRRSTPPRAGPATAIARSAGCCATSRILSDEPTPTLETYFRQCAIRVTCRDLALIGATLANGGVNPVTGIRAIAEEYVRGRPRP